MDNAEGDVAQLMPPVAISANGVLKIISAYRTGTTEVQQLLGGECAVILECKTCRSLYRSVANFISHKRNYCKQNGTSDSLLQNGPTAEAYAKIETINTALQRKDISHIAERLAVTASTVCSDGVVVDNKEATERVLYFTSLAESVKERRAARKEQLISLTPLPGTSKAVGQSLATQNSPPTPTPVASTDSASEDSVCQDDRKKSRGRPRKISLHQNHSSVVDSSTSSPQASTSDTSPSMSDKTAPNYCCEKCHAQFTSQKSLSLHESTQHMTTRMQYKCPCCKNSFCNLWSTYRHLKSIHRKTQEQVERMKPVIRKRAFKMTVPVFKSSSPHCSRASSPVPIVAGPVKPKTIKTLQQPEKAWVNTDNNFTVDVGDHRCGVCGLRFERKAALISHTNTCHRKPISKSSKSPQSGSPEVARVKPEGAANRKSSAPVKIVRGVRMTPTKPQTSPTKSQTSPTNVKENKATNKVGDKKSEVVKSLANGFQKCSSDKKSSLKVPPSMNPVVKLVYSNKNIMGTLPTRRSSPNIIKKATAKVFASNKKLAANIKSSIESKSALVSDVTQPKFIKLTPVNMSPSLLNVKTIIPFTLQKSPVKTYATAKGKTPENASQLKQEPQKAEIIVRTVSDKKQVSPMKISQANPVKIAPVNNSQTNPVKILHTSPINKSQVSPVHVLDKVQTNSVKLIQASPVKSSSEDRCESNGHDDRSSLSSRCSTTSSPDKARIGIQVRRDYAKVWLADSELSSRPGSALGVSDDEEFTGWDTTEDDYQGQLGLPQINDMDLVYHKLVSQNMPCTSYSECPSSPEQTHDECEEGSPVKTRGQREIEANCKRRRTET